MAKNHINELVESIIIFAPDFKQEIIRDARELEPERLEHLIILLKEIVAYQTEELKKKIAEDPEYLVKLRERVSARRKSIIETAKVKAESKDQTKINELINKIKKIF
jgi:hypothetical protein